MSPCPFLMLPFELLDADPCFALGLHSIFSRVPVFCISCCCCFMLRFSSSWAFSHVFLSFLHCQRQILEHFLESVQFATFHYCHCLMSLLSKSHPRVAFVFFRKVPLEGSFKRRWSDQLWVADSKDYSLEIFFDNDSISDTSCYGFLVKNLGCYLTTPLFLHPSARIRILYTITMRLQGSNNLFFSLKFFPDACTSHKSSISFLLECFRKF